MARNTLIFALKFVVSLSIIGTLFVMFDLGQVWSRLEVHSYSYLGLSLGTFLLLLINNALRWQVIFNAIGQPIPFILALRLQYIAAFFNQALPSVIGGDAIRVYLSYEAGIALQKSINSVILERIIATAGLIFVVTGLQSYILPQAELAYVQYVFPVLSAVAVSGIIILMLLDKLPSGVRHWRVVAFFSNIATDAKHVFFSPKHALSATGLSITGNVLISLIALFGARTLGIELLAIDALVLIPPALLASNLPISVAGWGVREGAMVATLAYAGVAEVDALVISIMFGFTMVVCSIPGGIVWLANKDRDAPSNLRIPE